MNRRGVEFTVVQVEPGLWRWQFQIGETVTTGKTKTNLEGLAARRVQERLDRELRKLRNTATAAIAPARRRIGSRRKIRSILR
jgi:hypothetical protein